MVIACLGWGSLCWDPRSLPIAGDWNQDGPYLPVEFSRVSSDGRITLVLTEGAIPVQVLWVPLAVDSLEQAITALAEREGVKRLNAIGRVVTTAAARDEHAVVQSWAISRGISGVVWTALKPGLDKSSRGIIPSLDQLREQIERLSPEARAVALDYVVRAPLQVETRLRSTLQGLLLERGS
jgi:hypothetical protein